MRTLSQSEREARDKSRLETFIDGVFAIAITLLGLEFAVPLVQHTDQALVASLEGYGVKFIGYFLAFALLAILFNNSWRQFQLIDYADWVVYFINILFLSFIVLVPFATALWTDYGDTIAGVLFFHGIMLLTGLTLYVNWVYVRRHPYLLKKDIATQTLQDITSRNLSLPIASVLAIVVAFFSPRFSSLAYLIIIVILLVASLRSRS